MIKNFLKYAARRKAYGALKSATKPATSQRSTVRTGDVSIGPKLRDHADAKFYPELRSIKAQLQSMDPYSFEQMVGDVWAARGYKTTVVGESGDGGRDVVASSRKETIAIQCKRYGPNTRVSPSEIREIAALSLRNGVTSVAMVTTSDLTEAANSEATQYNVDVYDCEDFMILIDEIGAEKLLAKYLPGVSVKRSWWRSLLPI